MAKKKDLKAAVQYYKFAFDLLQKIPCTKEENEAYQQILERGENLPDGVFAYVYADGSPSTTEFYTVYEADLSKEEIREYLTYKQLGFLKTIKNCVMFFAILTIISMVAQFILVMSVL